MKKENILVLTTSFPKYLYDVSGGGSFVFELCEKLVQFFNIIVITPHLKGAKKNDMFGKMKIFRYKYLIMGINGLTGQGAILQQLRKNKLNYLKIPFLLIALFINIIKINKKEKANLIHAHWLIPHGIIAVLYKLFINRNVKILVTILGGEIWSFNSRLSLTLKKFILRHIDGLSVVSSAIKLKVNELGYKKNIHVLPMGVNTNIFSPKKRNEVFKTISGKNKIIVLFAGYFNEKKGIEYLIQSIPEIIKKNTSIHFVFIGNGPLYNKCVKKTETLKITNFVSFLGAKERHEIPQYYASADIFIGPSIETKDGDKEGLPVVYMEAMASGCILIGTDLKGNYDLIKDGYNGFIINQKNSQAITNKVLEITENIASCKAIKKNARATIINNYDWKIIGGKYVDLINEMNKSSFLFQ